MNTLSPSGINLTRFAAILFIAAMFSCIDIFNDPEIAGSVSDEQTKTLTGKVVDVNGEPVQGVLAKLSVRGLQRETDGNGEFSFPVKDNRAAMAKTASGPVLDTLTLSYGGQPFFLELITRWDSLLAPVVLASKAIIGTVPANLPDIKELVADFNPAAPANKLNAEITLTLNRETGEFSGEVYYTAGSPEQTFILDISARGWNGEIVFSNLKYTFTHQTPLVEKGRIQLPSPAAGCDTCGPGTKWGDNGIFALSDSGSLPLYGIPLSVYYLDSNRVVDSINKITNSEGMIYVPNRPLLVTGRPSGCAGDTLYIDGQGTPKVYHLRFKCGIPVEEIVCDTCNAPLSNEITVVNDSTGMPLAGIPLLLYSLDSSATEMPPSLGSGLWYFVDTLTTDTNGNASIHGPNAPIAVIGFAPGCGSDTFFISGLAQTMKHQFRFQCPKPGPAAVCDTCNQAGHFTLTAVNDSSYLPLTGVPINLLILSATPEKFADTLITDSNGRVEVPYLPGPLMTVFGHIPGCGTDTIGISTSREFRNHYLEFPCAMPGREAMCDTCGQNEFYSITALRYGVNPMPGLEFKIAIFSPNREPVYTGLTSDTNGIINVPYLPGPLTITALPPNCADTDTLQISGMEPTRDFRFTFNCPGPVPGPLCDTCGRNGFFTITAINDSGLQPFKHTPIFIYTVDSGGSAADTMFTDANGMITVPLAPRQSEVFGHIPGCGPSKSGISPAEQNVNYRLVFDCLDSGLQTACDTCGGNKVFLIWALSTDSTLLAGVPIEIHHLDTGLNAMTDTMVTDSNGRIVVPYVSGSISVYARPDGYKADTLLISGWNPSNRYQLWFSKLPDICLEAGEQGPCNEAVPGYFYNQEKGGCVEFIWGGCDSSTHPDTTYGNRPFSTLDSCQITCE